MSFGSAGYTATFSGDFTVYLANKLKQRFDKLRKARKAKKVKAKKLLGRKKKETSDVAKAESLQDNMKPAETTAGLDQKLLPPEEPEQKVEKGAVDTVEGKGIFSGLVQSLEGLRAANASIRKTLEDLLKAKEKQSSALAVVGKNQYEDEVIDVEFVELDQKRLREAEEDVTVKAFGTSAIVKKEKKKKGPLGGFIEKVTGVLGGIGKTIAGVIKNPLALAGIVGGGLLLGDIFSNSAQAADGSIVVGGEDVNALTPFLNMIGLGGGDDEEEDPAPQSADYERSDPESMVPEMPMGEETAAMPMGGSNKDLAALTAISALESGSAQGQADVAQSIYNRLGDKRYGDSIFDVVTADAQYQPAYKDPTASSGAGTKTSQEFKNIRDEGTAVTAMQSYYRKRGINKSREEVTQQFRSAQAAIMNPTLQANARSHVGGRTEFLSSGSTLHRLDKPNERWRGGGSDNKFFAAYGSGNQLARGAVAPPANLFENTGSYQAPPTAPSQIEVLADQLDQAAPNIIFIPNTDVGIPVPSAGSAVRGLQDFTEDSLETLKQLRLWSGN